MRRCAGGILGRRRRGSVIRQKANLKQMSEQEGEGIRT
jgi:hypothetical protein